MGLNWANVVSTTGNLLFDINSDDRSEATLNQNGFGLGTVPSQANLQVQGNAIITTQLNIGSNTTGTSNLNISGTYGLTQKTYTQSANLGEYSICFADSSSSNVTLVLPYAGNATGRVYSIKAISSLNKVWLTAGNQIDSQGVLEIPTSANLGSLSVISNGSSWSIIKQFGNQNEVASDNLVAWYKLDETSGTVIYDSARGEHATLTDSGGNTSIVTGKHQYGRQFDGSVNSGAEVKCQSSGNTRNLQNGSFSISAWYYPNALAPNNGVVDDRHSIVVQPGFHRGLVYRYTGKFSMGDWDTGGTPHFANDTTVYPVQNWYHLVGVRDAQNENMLLYVNGVHTATDSYAGATLRTMTTDWRFGRSSITSTQTPAHGIIDDVRMYSKALSHDEIKALFANR
jgi:hypothetical protein